MAAARLNLLIEAGATFVQSLIWQDSDEVAIDNTGFTAKMQIRDRVEDTAALVTLTEGDGITLGGVDGTIELRISAVDTGNLPVGSAVYDLELTDASASPAEVTRLVEGSVTIAQQVTR